MQRTVEVEVSLNGLQVQEEPLFCQGDKNTHFINITFMNDMDLRGYTLQVEYLPPYPAVIPLIDSFKEITTNPFKIPIPDEILERNGKVKVEFTLSKETELITINKTFDFKVKRTANGTCVTAYPTGVLRKTISMQIEEIKKLLAESQNKINEYNNNSTLKTEEYNTNHVNKLKAYNDNDTLKTKNYNDNTVTKISEFNNNATQKTTDFNNNANEKIKKFNLDADTKATEAANNASLEANKLVVAQQAKSVKAVEDTASTEISEISRAGSGAVRAVESAKTTAVSNAKTEIDTYVDNTSKVQLDNYITQTSKPELDNYVTKTSKVSLDTYVNNTSKIQIDNYVTQKEGEIKGATFTPSVNPTGDLSWINDKGLPVPTVVNIKGPKGDKGDKGDKPLKGTDYYTAQEKQEFTTETVKLVTDEGTKQIGLVGTKGTEETTKVGSEGSKQVLAVQNQGSLSLDMLLKVQKEIETLLKNQQAIGNALSLNGKTGPEYDKETRNVAGGEFDSNLLFLNDAGTKTVGKLYYDKNKSGVFKCIQTTTETINSTTSFVDVSCLQNANKLENLVKLKKYNENNFVIETNDYIQLYLRGRLPSVENNNVGFPIVLPNANYIVTASFVIGDGKVSDNDISIVEKRTNGIVVHRGHSNTAYCFLEATITYFK